MYYWREESPEKLRELYRSYHSLNSKMVLGDHYMGYGTMLPQSMGFPLPRVWDLARAQHVASKKAVRNTNCRPQA